MKYDEINYWSEVKLDIIREYAQAYSRILSAQRNPELYHIYIDAFAGSGIHISKRTREFVAGSPLNALAVKPPFKEYHLIDLDNKRFTTLAETTKDFPNVQVYNRDCNEVLILEILPRCRWKDYRRALCLLDPYGLHLNWEVVETAGAMKSIEVFLNFPVADMNRNVLWKNRKRVDQDQMKRMNAYWGDDSWKQVAYERESDLFGFEQKTDTATVARAFQERLRARAGFSYVPDPVPMRNSKGTTIYYLFFASQKPVAEHIVKDIFKKYRKRGTA
jgi:three-Cys-motif partner protein